MKQNNNIYISEDGINLTDHLTMTVSRKKSIPRFIPMLLISFCGVFGTVFSFITMFDIPCSIGQIIYYTSLFYAAFSAIFLAPKKVWLLLLPILSVYEIILYRKWNDFLYGFMLVYNKIYVQLSKTHTEYFSPKQRDITPSDARILFLAMAIFLITVILCYVTITKPNFFMGFLFSFPFIELGLYYGKVPAYWCIFLLIAYWVSLLSIHQSGYYKYYSKKKSSFIKKGNNFYAKPNIKFRTAEASGLIVLLFTAAAITVASIYVSLSGFTRTDKVNTMRYNISHAVNNFTFDDVQGSLERISASFGLDSIKVTTHRLGQYSTLAYTGKTDLTIKLDKTLENNTYFKGYVGSVYSGKSWEEPEEAFYRKYNNTFDLFRNTGEFPQNFLYDSFNGSDSKIVNAEISTRYRNEKYNYTPYNAVPEESWNYVYDTVVKKGNPEKYNFSLLNNQDFDYLFYTYDDNAQITYGSSLSAHDAYSEFVRDVYLEVPDTDEMKKLKSDYQYLFKKYESGDPVIYTTLANIKNMLAEKNTYTLSPGKTPSDRDFVSYFLTENHKGYCVHFATSGVMLARMAGIPARYAEGYVVCPEDFSNKTKLKDGSYEIKLKDNRAHAWAEIYLEGVGWVPFEFTPSAAFNSQQIENHNKTTRPNVTITMPTLPQVSKKTTASQTHTTVKSTILSHTANKKSSVSSVNGKSNISPVYKLSAAAVFSIILITLFMLLRYKHAMKKRIKSFGSANSRQNTINAYKYLIRLLEFIDIKAENMEYTEFAAYAIDNSRHLFSGDEFITATKYALEASMGRHEIPYEDSKAAVKLSMKTAEKIYVRQSPLKKFYMRYILNLY